MMYLSKLKIDEAVNLDNENDAYNQLEMANTSIENASTVTGTKAKQVFMVQENMNKEDGTPYEADKVKTCEFS